MSETLNALVGMVEARDTQRRQADAMRRAQQAMQQMQQQANQGGGANCAGGAQGPGGAQGAQGPGGAQGAQQPQRQMSAGELGAQHRQNHQAGQCWQGFRETARRREDLSPQAGGAQQDALYRGLTQPEAAGTADAVRRAGQAAADTARTQVGEPADAARTGARGSDGATRDPADAAAAATRRADNTPTRDTVTNRGTGTTRQIRGFREISEQKLKDALPQNAKHLAKAFIESGRKHNIDPLALAGISGHETGNWTSSAFRNKNNAMGISDRRGPIHMRSAEESIDRMAKGLANPNGYYKNARTVAEIGRVYAPVGAENDPRGLNNHWTRGVSQRIDRLERAVLGN